MLELQRQEVLRTLAAFGDRFIDPGHLLRRFPVPSGRARGQDAGPAGWYFPITESLLCALVLLELADRSRQGLAEQILARVVGVQNISAPGSPAFGTWPRFLTESGARPKRGDTGLTAFNGMVLAMVWWRHHRRLTPDTLGRLRTSSIHAAEALAGRHHTTRSLGAAFVLLQSIDHPTGDRFLRSALDLLADRAKSPLPPPASLSGYIDELLGFAALRDYAARHPSLKQLPPLLEGTAIHLEAMGVALVADMSATSIEEDGDLRRLLDLLVLRASGQSEAPLRPCLDFRACLPCVMRTWVPASVRSISPITAKSTAPRLVGAT